MKIRVMKIEVGKFYTDASGNQIKVVYIHDNGEFPVMGGLIIHGLISDGVMYSLSGKNDFSSSFDLISEWVEPLDFDWDCLPKWADKWIAKNEFGHWFCFNRKPSMISEVIFMGISPIELFKFKISDAFIPKNFTGPWKDSLFKNPKYEDRSEL